MWWQTLNLWLPKIEEGMVNGFSIKVKHCITYMVYLLPHGLPCSVCNPGVGCLDHHCPWVGQCIGLRNNYYLFWEVGKAVKSSVHWILVDKFLDGYLMSSLIAAQEFL